jgi:hypothetical protein
MKMLRPTIASIVVERPQASAEQPQRMCLDAGCDFEEERATLAQFGFTGHLRGRGQEAKELRKLASGRGHE